MRKVLQKWIKASKDLYLYQGPIDNECAKEMMACDPEE